MTTPLPASIPDTQLGLSAAEIQILRQHQAIVLQPHSSTSSVRGRGNARNSSSSRGTSTASSGQGRLMLNPGSLSALGQHFDRLMLAIQGRVDAVSRMGSCPCTFVSLLLAFLVDWSYFYGSDFRGLDYRGWISYPNATLCLSLPHVCHCSPMRHWLTYSVSAAHPTDADIHLRTILTRR